jgi:hypothetical protein
MSYVLAPFEGWLALRSPYVLAIYERLPADPQEMARNEFVAIVGTGLIRDAVRILKGPGWRSRNELLPGLAKVRLDLRVQTRSSATGRGLDDRNPGSGTSEFRPWRWRRVSLRPSELIDES